MKWILLVAAIVVVALVALPMVFGSAWGGGWGMMGPWALGGFSMFIMPVLLIVVLGLIVWAVAEAARRPADGDRARGADTALEVLKKRYARGEITRDEYEAMKKDLV